MTYQQRTRAQRAAPPKASKFAAKIFADLAQRTRFVDPNLAANWPTIVGVEIAALCRPGKLTGAGQDRTLELVVPSGAAATQVQMRADTIKDHLNRYLGPRAVGHLAIKQRTPPPAKPAVGVSGEAGSPLMSALEAFGRSVGANRKQD